MRTSTGRWAALGAAFLLFSGLVAPGDSGAGPGLIRQVSEHFTFESHPKDGPYLEPITEQAERLWSRITQDIGFNDIGISSDRKIGVVIAFTQQEFNQFQPDGHPLPDWAVGVAYPAEYRMVLRSPRLVPGHSEDLLQVFTHELTHLVLAHLFGEHSIPRWLNEGLSMYESYEWRPSQDILMGRYVLSGRLIPLRQLTRSFQSGAFEVRQAYLQSYSLVNHMISSYGPKPFHRLIRRLSQGERFNQAAEQALGVSVRELEEQWIRHLKLRYNWLPLLTSSAFLWLLITVGVVWAYAHRKRRQRRVLEQWAEEEAIIYGPDPEDRP